jgi:hypothetical protein
LAASIKAAYEPFGGAFAGAAGVVATAFAGTTLAGAAREGAGFVGTGLLDPGVLFLETGLGEAVLALRLGADADLGTGGAAFAVPDDITGRTAGDLAGG